MLFAVPLLEATLLIWVARRWRRLLDFGRVSAASVGHAAAFSTRFVPATIAALIVPQAGVWLSAFVMSPDDVADLSVAIRSSFLLSVPL